MMIWKRKYVIINNIQLARTQQQQQRTVCEAESECELRTEKVIVGFVAERCTVEKRPIQDSGNKIKINGINFKTRCLVHNTTL